MGSRKNSRPAAEELKETTKFIKQEN
jgi:hypothetical protein